MLERMRRLGLSTLVAMTLVGCSGGGLNVTVPVTGPSLSPLPPVDLSGDPVVQVVDRVQPAIVNVTTNLATAESLAGGGESRGTGTGFIVDPNGAIVTNFHVVEGGLSIRVVMADGRRFNARVIGGDPDADLAVLDVDAEGLPTVPLGESSDLRLGEPVVALGFALALAGGPSVTSGIVSALGRTITAGDSQGTSRTYEDLIQTDAAINPGNSGGPLVDLAGRVIGINTAGIQAGSAENIGFAIAIDRARNVIEDAIANPAAPVAYMGVTSQTVDATVAFQLNLPVEQGALVVDVAPGGPADEAGIVPGDVIVSIGETEVTDDEHVRQAIVERRPGDAIDVELVRSDGSTATVSVTLGVRPLPVAGE
jgi:serine protease Do